MICFSFQAVEVAVSEGICYHNNDPPHDFQVEIRDAKITTLEGAMSYACKKHKNKRAVGTRQILRESEEVQKNGKVFKKVSCARDSIAVRERSGCLKTIIVCIKSIHMIMI